MKMGEKSPLVSSREKEEVTTMKYEIWSLHSVLHNKALPSRPLSAQTPYQTLIWPIRMTIRQLEPLEPFCLISGKEKKKLKDNSEGTQAHQKKKKKHPKI